MKRHIGLGIAAVILLKGEAYALDATSPISAANGTISCPTCVVEDSVSQYGIPVWGSNQNLNVITPSAQTTYALFSAGSSAAPAFRAIAATDLPSLTSSQLATILSDETGTAGSVVFSTSPTFSGLAATGTVDLSGATVSLPSGSIDAIADISSTILKGTSSVAKLVTTTSGSTTTNNCAKWDSNGNLVDSGGTCGGSASATPLHSLSTVTPVTVANTTPVYVSLSGDVSTTESKVRTPIANAATFGYLQCVVNAGTTNQVIATLGTGACTGSLTYTGTKATVTLSATANTTGTSSSTTSVTAGECVAIKLTTASGDATSTSIHCSMERTV